MILKKLDRRRGGRLRVLVSPGVVEPQKTAPGDGAWKNCGEKNKAGRTARDRLEWKGIHKWKKKVLKDR
jgi:hypothetical protein